MMNPSQLPLKGIRVADFGQVIAAPVTAQMLGWLGAEVVLVETESRFTTRVWPPFADGQFGINQSGGFNLVNSNKVSCSLDLSHPDALEVAKGIIRVSDVLVENYATGSMERLGLGYDEVKKLQPDIIYMSLGAFGRSGPFKDLTGFHSVINLFSGLAAVTGYPGSHPRIMGGLIPDAFSGCYCVLAGPGGVVPPVAHGRGAVHRGVNDRGPDRHDPGSGYGILSDWRGTPKNGEPRRSQGASQRVSVQG